MPGREVTRLGGASACCGTPTSLSLVPLLSSGCSFQVAQTLTLLLLLRHPEHPNFCVQA